MQINIFSPRALASVSFLAVMLGTSVASANPRPLPFTYPYETLPEGSLEVEQYVDYTPVRVAEEAVPNTPTKTVFDGHYVLQTELEYGITDRLELGTYLVFKQTASAADPAMRFEGLKERLRYRIADEGDLPIDIALYLEVAQFHDEFEIEEKVILAKRFGHLKLMANAWIEQEFERGKGEAEFIYNPTIGFTYQLHEKLSLGVEYWARGKFEDEDEEPGHAFNNATHHFLGPALSLQFGKLWWSTGAYYRLDHTKRAAEVGDDYGRIWVRSVFGVNL